LRLERVLDRRNVGSVNAPWHGKPASEDHWYAASTNFAVERLGNGRGSCLVIGSPLFEAFALERRGWEVTYLDVRKPPHTFARFIQADAVSIPLPDSSFDAVSSSCVLTHVGLGRYGDPIVKDGDEKMLCEVQRVMKPGAVGAITFGGVVDGELPVRVGNLHRVYTIKEAQRMCDMAVLEIKYLSIWSTKDKKWVNKPSASLDPMDYLSVYVAATK
jgi:hypothetical protein